MLPTEKAILLKNNLAKQLKYEKEKFYLLFFRYNVSYGIFQISLIYVCWLFYFKHM